MSAQIIPFHPRPANDAMMQTNDNCGAACARLLQGLRNGEIDRQEGLRIGHVIIRNALTLPDTSRPWDPAA